MSKKVELASIRVDNTNGCKLVVKSSFPWIDRLCKRDNRTERAFCGATIIEPLAGRLDEINFNTGDRELPRDRTNLAVLLAKDLNSGVSFDLPPMSNTALSNLCEQYKKDIGILYQEYLRPISCSHTLYYMSEGEVT